MLGAALVFGGGGCGEVKIVDADPSDPQDVAGADSAASDDDGVGVDSISGDAVGDECITDFDCVGVVKGTTPCRLPACSSGFCGLKDRPAATPCQTPGDTVGECEVSACDGAGQCLKSAQPDGKVCGLGVCGNKCSKGACVAATAADYDDGNPCTKDFCDQGQAVRHEPITDLTITCDDGDACTGKDACINGTCSGQPIDCADAVPCTVDTCTKDSGCKHTPDAKACDDGDPCTTTGCDADKGCNTTGFQAKASCDDGNACTEADVCDDAGGCQGKATCACKIDADCVSDNLCLGALVCTGGVCQTKPDNAVSCDSSANTACAVQQCQPSTGKCIPTAVADGLACDDGDACTTESSCKSGVCAGSKPPICDDDNDCTDDTCDSKNGCKQTPTTKPCDDDNACTDKDACANGGCKGVAKSCDDGIVCTLDSCDKTTGTCAHAPQNATCDDKNPCTADSCQAGKGCVSGADDSGTCDDGDACTVDACKGGVCNATNTCPCKPETAAKDCDDKNPCTVDTCDLAAKACKNTASGADGKACDTGDKCQQAGTGSCSAGVCKSGNKPVDCSAKNGPCTTGACVASTGLCEAISKADGIACDADGTACTANDACKGGVCTKGVPLVCDDNNPCTADSCDKVKGCVQTAIADATACEDGDACTNGDSCSGGKCAGGKPKICDDGSACSYDYCKGGNCVFEPVPNCCVKQIYAQQFGFKPPTDWTLKSSDVEARWRIRADISQVFSPPGVLHYGRTDLNGFVTTNATGGLIANSGDAYLPSLPLGNFKSVTMRFRLLWDVETPEQYDVLRLVGNDPSGAEVIYWTLPKFQLPQNAWHLVTVTIPGGNDKHNLRFRFDTVDGAANEKWTGIFIDDIVLEAPCQ